MFHIKLILIFLRAKISTLTFLNLFANPLINILMTYNENKSTILSSAQIYLIISFQF